MNEPSTLITDYLLATVCFVLAWNLWRTGKAGRWGSLSIGSAALAAFAGGTYHGFRDLVGAPVAGLLWHLTLACIGTGAVALLLAVVQASERPRTRRVLTAVVGAELVAYLVWIVGKEDFRWAVAEYLSAMALVVGFALLRRKRLKGSAPLLIAGVTVSLVAAGVQQSGISLHRHFNHNDLYHLIQIAAMVLLFWGLKRIAQHERRGTTAATL